MNKQHLLENTRFLLVNNQPKPDEARRFLKTLKLSKFRQKIYPYLFGLPLPNLVNIKKAYAIEYNIENEKSLNTLIFNYINGTKTLEKNEHKRLITDDNTGLTLKNPITKKKVYYYPNFAYFILIAKTIKEPRTYEEEDKNYFAEIIENNFENFKIIHNFYLNDSITRQILFQPQSFRYSNEKEFFLELKNIFYNEKLFLLLEEIYKTNPTTQEELSNTILKMPNCFSARYSKPLQIKHWEQLVSKYGLLEIKETLTRLLIINTIKKDNNSIKANKKLPFSQSINDIVDNKTISLPPYKIAIQKILEG